MNLVREFLRIFAVFAGQAVRRQISAIVFVHLHCIVTIRLGGQNPIQVRIKPITMSSYLTDKPHRRLALNIHLASHCSHTMNETLYVNWSYKLAHTYVICNVTWSISINAMTFQMHTRKISYNLKDSFGTNRLTLKDSNSILLDGECVTNIRRTYCAGMDEYWVLRIKSLCLWLAWLWILCFENSTAHKQMTAQPIWKRRCWFIQKGRHRPID